MARMIPATLSLKTESRGAEENLFHALRDSLDNSYTIFHSFDLLARNLQRSIIDVEIDFLIFSHKQGLLSLEVKGGIIKHDGAIQAPSTPPSPARSFCCIYCIKISEFK